MVFTLFLVLYKNKILKVLTQRFCLYVL